MQLIKRSYTFKRAENLHHIAYVSQTSAQPYPIMFIAFNSTVLNMHTYTVCDIYVEKTLHQPGQLETRHGTF